jgi:hypothetical protein
MMNVVSKAWHVYQAVNVMYNSVELGMHITWKECCEVAIKDELSKYSPLAVMTWYVP